MATLKVRARAGRHVPDRAALDAGARRFIGRRHVPKEGAWPFPRVGVVEIPDHGDYRIAIRNGDLVPVDEATAKACGVDWEACAEMLDERESGDPEES